jgi:ferredoxin-type protein NapH
VNLDNQKTEDRSQKSEEKKRKIPLSKLRRFVLLGIIILFLLQFAGIKALVGSLTGSVAVWFVKLIDVFAYFEGLIASKDFTMTAFWAVLPVIALYLIFGRAFCGWVCPMDFLYEIVNRLKVRSQEPEARSQKKILNISPKAGYVIVGVLLAISALMSIPFFTNYISHLTNFFRALTGSVFMALDLPVEPVVVAYSFSVIAVLLVLEYTYPRLWCRVLCPVGKTYGLFNKVSLLKLKFVEGECGECGLCDQMCYMNVNIAKNIDKQGLRDINCIYCGRCVEGCETKGRLIKMKIGGIK